MNLSKNKIRLSQNTLAAFILILFFAHCQEPYLNESLNANKLIPVFNGTFSNIDRVNSFELYYAMPYNQNQKERISGAIISLTDENHTITQLSETSTGTYELEQGIIKPQSGNSYTVTIEMPDGQILQSKSMPYLDTLAVPNIFFDFNIKTFLTKNTDDDFIEVSQEGILVQLRLKSPQSETVYYRAHANYYVHSQTRVQRVREITIDDEHYDILYEVHYDTLYDIIEGFAHTDFPEFGELVSGINYSPYDLTINPLFLPADRECLNFSAYTQYSFIEWIVPVDVYHHNYDVYKYYEDASKQLTAPGQIFDPMPEQMYGNLKNVTNPTEPVLGIFDVSSVNRKHIAVYVHEALGYRSYQSKILNDTVLTSGWYPRNCRVDTIFIDSIPKTN